ncbi:MAG: hypothetical protein ACMG55_12245 [Microcoleus sp.]
MRGKERGLTNENASKFVYFASLSILAVFWIYQSIFRMFLDFKFILEYFLNIKRDKNKTKINLSNNLGFRLWGLGGRQLMTCATGKRTSTQALVDEANGRMSSINWVWGCQS